MSNWKMLSALACTALLGAMFASSANAQEREVVASYAAKFVCGPIKPDADVVTGVYATSINIHNPNEKTAAFTKKIVLANEEGQTPGCIVVDFDRLAPDRAERVDCPIIVRKLLQHQCIGEGTVHTEGFVVLQYITECLVDRNCDRVRGPLDVVGKYTARPSTGEVSSLDLVVYPVQILPQ